MINSENKLQYIRKYEGLWRKINRGRGLGEARRLAAAMRLGKKPHRGGDKGAEAEGIWGSVFQEEKRRVQGPKAGLGCAFAE